MSFFEIWDTPFLEDRHRELAKRLLQSSMPEVDESKDFRPAVLAMLKAMADAKLLHHVIPKSGDAGIDLRSICIAREILAYRGGGLADTAFIMQGIGTAPLWLSNSGGATSSYLDRARAGEAIAAFAVTEPGAGSDIAAIQTEAVRHRGGYTINGAKTYITNAGIADHYLVLARTGEGAGSRGLSLFLVDSDTPGVSTDKQEYAAPHPGGSLLLQDCFVDADRLIGAPGEGFKLAMATFDIFRVSVGAAALGFGRLALDEVLARITDREIFGKPMFRLDGVQLKLADMIAALDGAGLQVYRAAWLKDVRRLRATREASLAKLMATEAAQQVVDSAVQLFGGAGVVVGSTVERLYREVRPMRIYEGASEVQKLLISRETVRAFQESRSRMA